MSNEYGNDFITITDEDGVEYELELIDRLEYNGQVYMALVSAQPEEGGSEEEEEELIILKAIEEDGEELLSTVDDEDEENTVYELFMDRLFVDDE